MATCRKCGLPLSFVKRAGKRGVLKWFPVNPDGSEHWDLCKQTVRARPENREYYRELHKQKSQGAWTGKLTHAYDVEVMGGVPPWDESLKGFRHLSADEKNSKTEVRL